MHRYKELIAWQRADAFVLAVYRHTSAFPAEERYGITSQLRRAVVSIPTNLAEGSKRRSDEDFARFVNMAEGSAEEVEYLLGLSCRLGYADDTSTIALEKDVDEIKRMLHTFRMKLIGD